MGEEVIRGDELGSIARELGEIGVSNDDARFAEWARKYGARLCFTAASLTRVEEERDEAVKALGELVALKNQKDAGFKTFVEDEAYRVAKPLAWGYARRVHTRLSRAIPTETERSERRTSLRAFA